MRVDCHQNKSTNPYRLNIKSLIAKPIIFLTFYHCKYVNWKKFLFLFCFLKNGWSKIVVLFCKLLHHFLASQEKWLTEEVSPVRVITVTLEDIKTIILTFQQGQKQMFFYCRMTPAEQQLADTVQDSFYNPSERSLDALKWVTTCLKLFNLEMLPH